MKVIALCLLVTFSFSCKEQMDTPVNNEPTLSFLALGDSYTIGESVLESERWPVQFKDSLEAKGVFVDDPKIIATTGWRTDQLKEALALHKKFDYDMVSLLIGVNNQYQGKSAEDYSVEFEELLNLAVERAGGDKDKVFVVSIPDYGYTPFGKQNQEKITRELNEYNEINLSITREYGIRYFDITPISRGGLDDPDLVAPDSLHPSGKQYSLWVAEMVKDLEFVKALKQRGK
jgi:lysophospholipase L1-like esterase